VSAIRGLTVLRDGSWLWNADLLITKLQLGEILSASAWAVLKGINKDDEKVEYLIEGLVSVLGWRWWCRYGESTHSEKLCAICLG
jgi:hypothetical protein